MTKKTFLLLILAILGIGVIFLVYRPKPTLITSPQLTKTAVSPSTTLKSYTDQAGFSFNYPDNLSLKSNEPQSPTVYADIELTSKDVVGSLTLKISDTNFASVVEWLQANNPSSQTPKEVKLGNLKALEITAEERLLLGAIDQGVLFTIEMSLKEEKDFWMNVYSKILADYAFVQPAADSTASQGEVSSASDVVFEGEEVVE